MALVLPELSCPWPRFQHGRQQSSWCSIYVTVSKKVIGQLGLKFTLKLRVATVAQTFLAVRGNTTMKSVLKSGLASALLLSVAMTGSAKSEGTYPFAATGHVAGGGSWTDRSENRSCSGTCLDVITIFGPDDGSRDIATLVGGGDFVLPLNGLWNLQLGGAWRVDRTDFEVEQFFVGDPTTTFAFVPSGNGLGSQTISMTNKQFQGSAIAFWRDASMGLFGIEAGLQSPSRYAPTDYVKLGAVAEYFFADIATFAVFGGAFIPLDDKPFGTNGPEFDTGFHVGGDITYYASANLGFAGFGRYSETGNSSFYPDVSFSSNSSKTGSLIVGGKIRYLTSLSGTELFLSGAYTRCENNSSYSFPVSSSSDDVVNDGVEIMAGINIRLGGETGSLVQIDRSNAIDTDTWFCGMGGARMIASVEDPT